MGWPQHSLFRRSLTGKVAVIALFCCLSLVLFDAAELRLSRQERLAQAGREVANLADSLAQYSQGVFQTADTALIGLRSEVRHHDGNIAIVQSLMFQHLHNLPTLHGLFLFGPDGRWIVNTVPGTPPDLNYANRDYFRYHRTHPGDVRLIGNPIQSLSDHSWVMTITRRINDADGNFGGVLTATVSTELFQHFFAGFDIGPNGSITMVDESGTILVREPFDIANVGRNVGNNQGFRESLSRQDSESFAFTSALDGSQRLGAYHRIKDTNLRILVSRTEADILAPWWQEARVNLACLIMVVLVALLLSRRIGVELRDRAHAERLYRLLADNSEDAIVCGSLTGQCRYVSPSLSVITFWPAEALRGDGWRLNVADADRAIVEAALSDLQNGVSQVSARYRYLRPDGSLVWVEMRARLASTQLHSWAIGSSVEFVANIRDIARQKQAEEDLEEANAELSAISVTDALTGIANRRQFDQILRKEWNRAMRTASPVALLMIDTDHFKAYNDLYGHPMGDQCLRLVAQAISRSALRAGDLATRYGGEEFAVILPDTIAEMAAQVADRVIEALLVEAVPHRGALRGIVTVSIGVASMIPDLGSNPAELVEQADIALYRAKHSGRAQVVVAAPTVQTHPSLPDRSRSAA